MKDVSFFVAGTPQPKGSTKSFMRGGKIRTIADNDKTQKPWASIVSYVAMQHMVGQVPTDKAVELSLRFLMPRPKSHYGSGKNSAVIKESYRLLHHVSKPDLDKLTRCIKDALTGIVWKDDSQVCSLSEVRKEYIRGINSTSTEGRRIQGVWIYVREL